MKLPAARDTWPRLVVKLKLVFTRKPTPVKTLRCLTLTAALLCVLSLSACLNNTAQSRINSDYAATVKNVGVVSLLDPKLNISYLGTSAQESVQNKVAPSGWNADRVALEVVVPRLKRTGYVTRPLARNAAMEKARNSDWRSPLADSVAAAAYALGEANQLDMVVVVQGQVDEDFVTDTNQKVRGYGLQQAFDSEPFIYATVFVEAYDIKKRFAVGRAGGHLVEPAPAGLWDPAFATRGQAPTLSEAQRAAIAEPVEQVLRTAIGIAAQEAGL